MATEPEFTLKMSQFDAAFDAAFSALNGNNALLNTRTIALESKADLVRQWKDTIVSGGTVIPPAPPAPAPAPVPNATIAYLKTVMAAAPATHAAIPTTNVGTIVLGTIGDKLNPIRIPGASGTFVRHWMQNGSNDGGNNNNQVADLRQVAVVKELSSLGPAVGGQAELISPDGSSRQKAITAGGAWSSASGSIADFAIGFTLGNARGFGVPSRFVHSNAHVYVSENGSPLTLMAQKMTWIEDESYSYIDFGTVGTRNVVWVGQGGIESGEIVVGANATMAPYDWTEGKFLYGWMGDSWGQSGENVRGLSLPQATAKLLGASHIVGSTIGGTGFIANTPTPEQPQGSQPPGTNATRISAWTSGKPLVLDCSLIVNDNTADPAALRAAVDTVLSGGRAACPDALIIVKLWNSQGSRSTNTAGGEYQKMVIIRERARLMTGKWIIVNCFDGTYETSDGTKSTTAIGPMITGEGSVESPVNDGGNANTLIDNNNGRHLTFAGVIYAVNYTTKLVKEALASMASSATAAPSPSASPTVSSLIVGQTGNFTLQTTTAVKYGALGSNLFYQKTLPPGTYECGDQFFGDPAPGEPKACYLVGTDASSPPQSPSSAPAVTAPAVSSLVAGQTGTFTLQTTTAVKYGSLGLDLFYQKTLPPGTYECGDDLFSDPAPGEPKACYLVGTDASSPPQSPN